MKNMKLAKLLTLVLLLAFTLSMTGCDALDYRKAVDQYNAGNFDDAARMFALLEDYENSAALVTRSHYWAAITVMEQGDYADALSRFLQLGDYEDSPQRATECKYLLAAEKLETGSYAEAETLFLELGDYKQTAEYLRRLNWQKLYDALPAEGISTGTSEGMQLQIFPQDGIPDQLVFFVSRTREDMGYAFYDDLALTLTRDSLEASFTATSTFTMAYLGTQIGSRQTASGTVDISACTPQTTLSVTAYELTGTDNQGNSLYSTDPADILMADTMAEDLAAMLSILPTLLESRDIPYTLQDIGFPAFS